MAPVQFKPQAKPSIEPLRTKTAEASSRFDNNPLAPFDDIPSAIALKDQRPLPTTYLLSLAQTSDTHDEEDFELLPEALLWDRLYDKPATISNNQYGIADSVMAPLTAQDGPMIVVLLSIMISVVLVVENDIK
ncbi:hypothetical protein BKA67DRAFT_665272 [Truncatella angustata]|uniref:Uncharacterized protein n=1 Tax=Truncatella angustata TaxID=152316 RepID=A0A9P8RIS0_9PEZI|nr:uncharacterized protein BKA67DRAFT_665272 [Truncatella angustata]KAH6643465.1 hypothetical protein BKA67DRAFT_665272 [Truncatella angustata]